MYKNLKEYYNELDENEKMHYKQTISIFFYLSLATIIISFVIFLFINYQEVMLRITIGAIVGSIIGTAIGSGLILHKIKQYDKENES